MNRSVQIIYAAVLVVGLGSVEAADVFNMSTGLTSLEFVPVGNSGNADDIHGDGYGGVDYEYRISKYEVTAGQYAEFLNAVAKTDTYGLYNPSMWSHSHGCKIQRTGSADNWTYDVAADWANRPVNFVSWGDAARFANWLDNGQLTGVQNNTTTEDGSYFLDGATSNASLLTVNRESDAVLAITSEDEWYKAAYYSGSSGTYYDYPTGTDVVPDNGNPGGDTGNTANYYDGDQTVGDPYYRTPVGQFDLSDSPYGTFDQGGNVWEWNEGIINTSYRGLRGGSFEFAGYVDGYDLSVNVRSYNEPTTESYNIGFRVSEVPEPTTMMMLTLGGLAVLRRSRGRK